MTHTIAPPWGYTSFTRRRRKVMRMRTVPQVMNNEHVSERIRNNENLITSRFEAPELTVSSTEPETAGFAEKSVPLTPSYKRR